MSASHAAPSRDAPTLSTDLEAGRDLHIGEFTDDPTLNLSEARIILAKSLEARAKRAGATDGSAIEPPRETETLSKTRIYLELFAAFKEMSDAEAAERIIHSFAGNSMERFERSQLGSLVPTCADEAKALIPSLEKKVETGEVQEEDLEALCKELNKIKRQGML